jgi:aspartate aminotransferase
MTPATLSTPKAPRATDAVAPRLSASATELRGSAILKIANEVTAHAAAGHPVANLTVGDFSPTEFPIPVELRDAIIDAVKAGESNYPPSLGVPVLRSALQNFYKRSFGTEYGQDQFMIAAGARPPIYAIYRTLIDPGDPVIFGVPSWNNDYYCYLTGAKPVPIECDASTNFLPTLKMLAPHLPGARLLALNSPLNPTGTVFDKAVLAEILDAVLAENKRRGTSERPLYVMFDQVYWMITVGGAKHVDPLTLRPAMAPYLINVDGISKAFASTGLRVGWAMGPADIIKSMIDVTGHVGAWAPRPEQIATGKFLDQAVAVNRYVDQMRESAANRLFALADGLSSLAADGFPVECVRPQGAIYVSVRFALMGKRTPDGQVLQANEEIRKYLLTSAGFAVVPFQAFGLPGDTGWFRASIGVASVPMINELMPRIKAALGVLK